MTAVAVAIRDLRKADAPSGTVLKRVTTAAVLIPLFVAWVWLAPPALFAVLVIAVVAAGVWELTRMFAEAGYPTAPRLSMASAVVVAASFALPAPALGLTGVAMVVLAAAVCRHGAPATAPTLIALLGTVYIGWLMGHAVLLRGLPDGPRLVLFLVAVTWTGETAAYVLGSVLGRHKLAPRVSPGKTIEGAMAQLIASAGVAVALTAVLPGWTAWQSLGAGTLIGFVGQVGDLAESAIKRSTGAKDASALIPGHGGILDRLDGLLFNVPVFFYYASLVSGRP